MSDLLDLDALAPLPRTIKFQGKTYKCLPLTISQLVNIARLEDRLEKIKSLDEIETIVRDTLTPFLPDLEKEEKIPFSIEQMRAIIKFAQESQVPAEAPNAKTYAPKKKESSPKESPDSVDSTQDTKPKTS